MRLSIAIVCLIGAMVATKVICDNAKEKQVAIVGVWFKETVDRLQGGQTPTQNRKFIDLAIDRANDLLKALSYERSVVRDTDNNRGTHNFDRVLIGRIEMIQNDVLTSPNTPVVLLKHYLEAIKQVLHGNLQLAKEAIELSTGTFSDSISEKEKLGSNLKIPDFYVGCWPLRSVRCYPQHDHCEGESSLDMSAYVNPSLDVQILVIRKWLDMILGKVLDPTVDFDLTLPQLFNMKSGVTEIAGALISSLPDKYFPNENSKFIGRFRVEDTNVIWPRIKVIVDNITQMERNGDVEQCVVVVKDVLGGIRLILKENWAMARKAINSHPKLGSQISLGQVEPFDDYMVTTYYLRAGPDKLGFERPHGGEGNRDLRTD